MAHPLEHVEYLSKELGARPAGTEEEQNAALYIADQIQKETNFHAEIEEFTSSSNFPYVQAICCAVIVVVTVLVMFVPVLAIPAFVLGAVSAAIYALEAFDRPIVTRALARSASQNVVAKYQPNPTAESGSSKRGQRTRKIVLVAHYDSGKVVPGVVDKVESTGWPIGLICVGATIAAAFLLLIRIFLGNAAGVASIILNILSIVAILIALLPIVKAVLIQTAPYNEGANNNAAGVAAMMEVARRISRGSVSEADLVDEAEGVAIHGEAAAIANGLVPEGAEIRYEAERLTPPEMEPLDDEERLLSAKAAIAALTGKPVEKRVYGSVADHLVNTRSEGALHFDQQAAEAGFEPAQPEPEQQAFAADPVEAPELTESDAAAQAVVDSFDNAPSWFVAAQQKAKRSGDTGTIQRSRYTEAIEAAEKEAAERERARQEEERARQEEERQAREKAAREKIAAASAVPERASVPVEPEPEIEPAAEPTVEVEPVVDGGIEFQPVVFEAETPKPDATVAVAPISMADLAAELAEQGEEIEPEAGTTTPFEPVEEEQPARRRVVSLPSIDEKPAKPVETTSPSRSGLFRKLRADVPSMSGVIRMQEAGQDVSQKPAERNTPRPTIQGVPNPGAAPVAAAEPEVDYDMELSYGDASDMVYADEPAAPRDVNYDDQYDDQYGDQYEDDGFEDEFYQEEKPRKRRFFWQGGAFSRIRLGHVNTRSGEDSSADEPEELVELEEDIAVADEIEKIYHFRNPLYTSEIWFVAIGSDTDAHDGALAFVDEHKKELRGAMVIEVESLGLGDLSVASEEGRFRKVNASSRIKRYMRGAQAATGITPTSVKLAGSDSIASIVQKAGFQAMHLFGAEGGKPALKGSVDDVLENIDEDVLDDNVNFLMELLKHN